MSADGNRNVEILGAIICLGAAMAVKKRLPGTIEKVTNPETGEPVPDDLLEFLRKLHAEAMAMMRPMTTEELDAAIASYTLTLERLGMKVDSGYLH